MNEDAEDVGPVLGSIRMAFPNASDQTAPTSSTAAAADPSQPNFSLKLNNAATAHVPQEYKMQIATANGPATLAFSSNAGRFAGEGVVQHRLEVDAPGATRSAGGDLTIDPAYRKLSKARYQAASTKTRTVQMMTDHKITNIRKPVSAQIGGTKRKAETKRTAIDAQELQAILFRKFERQAQWSFAQLQRETEQPTPHLKAVLSEIAAQNKRGPYRDLWELKKEFRTGGGGNGS